MELLEQERQGMNGPTVDGGVIDGDAALDHHLLEIPQAQVIGQVPPDAQLDNERSKWQPLKIIHVRS